MPKKKKKNSHSPNALAHCGKKDAFLQVRVLSRIKQIESPNFLAIHVFDLIIVSNFFVMLQTAPSELRQRKF
jgi:hypothetical protein